MQRTYGFDVRSTGQVATLLSHRDGKSAEVGSYPGNDSPPGTANQTLRLSVGARTRHRCTSRRRTNSSRRRERQASSNTTSPLTASPLFTRSRPSAAIIRAMEIVIVQVAAEFG